MRITVLLLFLIRIHCGAAPVGPAAFDVRKLQVRWEVVENSHANKSQFLSVFTFTNTAAVALPASGWSLYFNFVRRIQPESVTGRVSVSHANGDLYRLYPQADFKGLAPGASLRVEFIAADWVVNVTDAPAGLYMVWDDQPTVGTPLTNYTIIPSTQPRQTQRFAGDKVGLITPAVLYDEYATTRTVADAALTKVFPTPVEYKETGERFILTSQAEIVADNAFAGEARHLADALKPLLGKALRITDRVTPGKPSIVLEPAAATTDGAYTLRITTDQVRIAAHTAEGIFYGIQSLKTLVPPAAWAGVKDGISLPGVTVADAPRFEHRAFFLDVCRNFHSKEQVLKLLDVMSLYKLNVLHFHVTDDEGWRLEIPSLPELVAVGGRRGHTPDNSTMLQPSFGSGPDASRSTGTGYYTREDYISILRYATERHIRVIPEIEAPGHARAAVKAMDARYTRLMKAGQPDEARKFLLRDTADRSEYRSVQGWNDNIVNVAVPSVYTFLEHVTDEIVALYKAADAPLTTIHFGGDEVPAGVWEKSPACQALLQQDENLNTVDDLWYYFYGRINTFLQKRGLTLYGWEEIAMRKTTLDGQKHYIPNPDFVGQDFQVDVWNNALGWGSEDLAYRLANAGYKVVLSCVSHLYFDMAYYKAFDEPGYYWGAFVDVDKPFYFMPYDYFRNAREDKFGQPIDRSLFIGKERLTEYGKKNIVGLQGLLWSETITSPERMEYMVFPKLLGLAERAWAKDPAWATEPDEQKAAALYADAWSAFATTLGKRELPRLDYYHGGFAYRIPTPGAVVDNGAVLVNQQLPGFVLRYTTDGKEPTAKSKVCPARITEQGTITIRAFSTSGRGGKSIVVQNAVTLPLYKR